MSGWRNIFQNAGTPKIVVALFDRTVRTLVKPATAIAELNVGVKRTHQSWTNITTRPTYSHNITVNL